MRSRLLPIVLVTGCTQSSAPEASPTADLGVLYFTSGFADFGARCAHAGLAHLAPLLEADPNARWVDAGNLLLSAEDDDGPASGNPYKRARTTARLLRQLDAVALNLGPGELRGGASFLFALQREGALPLVSANVAPIGKGAPSVARSFVRTVGPYRIAVTGIVPTDGIARRGRGQLATLEHAPAVANEVSAVRQDPVDLVLVLAQVDPAQAEELALEVPEADVILHAGGGSARVVGRVVLAPFRQQPQRHQVGRMVLGPDGLRVPDSELAVRFDWMEVQSGAAPPPRAQAVLQAVAAGATCGVGP